MANLNIQPVQSQKAKKARPQNNLSRTKQSRIRQVISPQTKQNQSEVVNTQDQPSIDANTIDNEILVEEIDFTKSVIDELLRIKKGQTNEPSHYPKRFLEQIYFQIDGKVWINIENVWYKIYDDTDLFPDFIPFSQAGINQSVRPSYSDDVNNIPRATNDLIATLQVVLNVRTSFFTKKLDGNEQKVKPSDIWVSTTAIYGLLVYQGYLYILLTDGSNYRVYRCSTDDDISDTGNWTQMTVSGTAISGTSYLIGAKNGLWIATGSSFMSYTISDTTLTSGTAVTVTGAQYSIESRVNENGIYADFFSTYPYYRRADFDGTIDADSYFYIGGTPSTSFTFFCSPTRYYATIFDSSNQTLGFSKID